MWSTHKQALKFLLRKTDISLKCRKCNSLKICMFSDLFMHAVIAYLLAAKDVSFFLKSALEASTFFFFNFFIFFLRSWAPSEGIGRHDRVWRLWVGNFCDTDSVYFDEGKHLSWKRLCLLGAGAVASAFDPLQYKNTLLIWADKHDKPWLRVNWQWRRFKLVLC